MTKNEFVKRQSNKVLQEKLALERTFKRDLRTYFAEQARRKKRGLPFESIQPVLETHYKRVIWHFAKVRVKQDVLQNNIENGLQGRAEAQATEIDGTTEEYWQKSVEQARADNPGQPESVILLVALRIFRNYNKSRIENIGITETQIVSETTRRQATEVAHLEIENAILRGNYEDIKKYSELSEDYTSYQIARDYYTMETSVMIGMIALASKQWVTMGDARVRDIHQEANGQTVLNNDPFMVGGELLMHPGDTSLGASARNIVRCRCVAVYL